MHACQLHEARGAQGQGRYTHPTDTQAHTTQPVLHRCNARITSVEATAATTAAAHHRSLTAPHLQHHHPSVCVGLLCMRFLASRTTTNQPSPRAPSGVTPRNGVRFRLGVPPGEQAGEPGGPCALCACVHTKWRAAHHQRLGGLHGASHNARADTRSGVASNTHAHTACFARLIPGKAAPPPGPLESRRGLWRPPLPKTPHAAHFPPSFPFPRSASPGPPSSPLHPSCHGRRPFTAVHQHH